MAGPCSVILRVCEVTPSGALTQPPSASTTDCWICWITRLSRQRAAHSATWMMCRDFSCSWSHSKSAAFWVTWEMGRRNILKKGICCLPNLKRPGISDPSFFALGDKRRSNDYSSEKSHPSMLHFTGPLEIPLSQKTLEI